MQRLNVAIVLVLISPVLCGAEGKTVENIGKKIAGLSSQVATLDAELSKGQKAEQTTELRRNLIRVFRELAVQHGYLRSESDRVQALYRVEAEYEALEKLGSENPRLASDVMNHVDFLCDIGFGGLNEYGLRQPEPDYMKALGVIEDFSRVLGKWGQDKKDKILGPVVGLSARRTETRAEAIVGIFVRNVDQLTVSIRENSPGAPSIVSWPVEFQKDWLFDHRTHMKFFLVSDIPRDKALLVVAGTDKTTEESTEVLNVPGTYETYRPDSPDNQVGSSPVNRVRSFYPTLPRAYGTSSKGHSMNQVCSLCHIPHTTSGE